MIRAEMKYVSFGGYNGEQIIIFPKKIQHSHFADSIKKLSFGTMYPISGGFIVDGKCVGRSESLRMDSRGDRDTALISNLIDTAPNGFEAEFNGNDNPEALASKPLNKNKEKRLRKKGRK